MLQRAHRLTRPLPCYWGQVKVFARRPLDLPDHEIGRGEVSLAKIKSGAETTVPLQHVHHHKRAHTGDISFVAHHDGTHSSGMPSQDAAVPGTAGVTGDAPFAAWRVWRVFLLQMCRIMGWACGKHLPCMPLSQRLQNPVVVSSASAAFT